jgi:hypothetical protein
MTTRVYGTVRSLRGYEEVDLLFPIVELPGGAWSPEFSTAWLKLMDQEFGDPFGWRRHYNSLVMFERRAG